MNEYASTCTHCMNYMYINAEVSYCMREPTCCKSTVAKSLLCLAKLKVRHIIHILPTFSDMHAVGML